MAREGDAFFHVYRMPAEGGAPQQLTDGPFFDIDPAELPDGRVVFTSTRMGTFEEYHNPPSRALYAMNADGSEIRPITNTIIFDNEPEVLADGRILFVRSDNFFDRGKVETLLHATFPDGTRGQTEFGLDQGPEYGGRLRAFNCGSPAPMPDGHVAYVSSAGITVGRMGHAQEHLQNFAMEAGDVAALPDGRLLCTVGRPVTVEVLEGGQKKSVREFSYEEISILDPQSQPPVLTMLHDAAGAPLHSPVWLGARPRPPRLHAQADIQPDSPRKTTGMIFCQNARYTKNTTAGWGHVRAIRVLKGTGLTTRSSHSYIVHAGNETVELGTVPLAPDGSFFAEVPADTPIALQAVDAEGRSELNEMSWLYVRPGERRTCVGCHQPRQAAPVARAPRALALMAAPVELLGDGQPHRFRGNNPAVTGLMELQFDRFREVAGINRHSRTDSPTASGQDDVGALIAQLQEGDGALKTSAARVLALFRDAKAAPALAAALNDASRELRLAAAVALASCGTRDSVPPLLAALSDDDPVVAQGAAMALENLTGHSEPFNPFTDTTDRQAWGAWFAGTSWEAIEDALVKQVESGDRDRVRRAAVALGHTGGPNARAALRGYVSKEQGNNPYPAWRKDGHESDGASFNALAAVNPRTLQAATRALGQVGDGTDVAMLSELLVTHGVPATGNLFLAEAAAEALGRIGTPEAETALIQAFAGLKDYPDYTYWYGDHPALMSCHASPVHYFVIEALDTLGSTRADAILPHLIRSVPIDPDRALLLPNDDYETLVGRVLRRHAAGPAIIETCLALLGDSEAQMSPAIKDAVSTTIRCWGGHPGPEIRAAQTLSLACRDQACAPRVQAALLRYSAMDSGIKRVFNTGIPVVDALPVENWVSFFLARTLGNLANPQSADGLIALLEQSPAEAATGRPDPLGPGVLFLHNGLTPCWRAAVAWALGKTGAPQAAPVLLKIVRDLDNAPDTRHAAAVALGACADAATREAIRELAAGYPERATRMALLEASCQGEHSS
jgi:HEAT repeat protein